MTRPEPGDRLLSAREAADLVGRAPVTVHRWWNKDLPHVTVDGHRKIRISQLRAYCDAHGILLRYSSVDGPNPDSLRGSPATLPSETESALNAQLEYVRDIARLLDSAAQRALDTARRHAEAAEQQAIKSREALDEMAALIRAYSQALGHSLSPNTIHD